MASRSPMPFHFRSAHDFPLQKVTHLLEPQQDYHYTNGASNGVIGAQHLGAALAQTNQAPVVAAPQPKPAAVQPGHLPPLDIACAGNSKIMDIHDYGERLAFNKSKITQLADAMYRENGKDPHSGIYPQRKAVMVAIAMLETTYMDISQRDASKDHTPAANVTILNMNYDMLHQITGYTAPDYGMELNNGDQGLQMGLSLMDKCFDRYPIKNILDYHRGGYTGFHDGVSYDCYGYRNAILTVYNQFNQDPSLITDGRRIEISVMYE